jgi:hypothetical protein
LPHPLRVGVDRPPFARLDLAPMLAAALQRWSRPAIVVRLADFLRPASLRLEHGRDDPDAFYDDWIDVGGLQREVLEPAGPGGSRRVLPSLWDAAADRATRADYQLLPEHAVVIVDGWFLLRGDLAFDLTVHVALSPAARARLVPPGEAARTLPAFERYDAAVGPAALADIVVRADDARHPAVVERQRPDCR